MSQYIYYKNGTDEVREGPRTESGVDYYCIDYLLAGGTWSQAENTGWVTVAGEKKELQLKKNPIGNIITDNFARSSLGANWVQSAPTMSIALDGSKLVWSHNSVAITYDEYVVYKDLMSLERWECEIQFTPSTLTKASYGMGIRWESADAANNFDMTIQLNTSNNSLLSGFIYILNNANNALVIQSDSSINIIDGSSYLLKAKREKNLFMCYAKNLNDNSECYFRYMLPNSYPQTTFLPNIGRLGFQAFGGIFAMSYNVAYCKISSEAFLNPYTCIIGDSITVGTYVGNEISDRWVDKIFGTTNSKYNIFASNGDKITSVISRQDEILRYKPNYALLMIGANDAGTNHAAWQASYEAFLDTLIAASVIPVVCYVTPNTGSDIRWMNTILSTICGARSVKVIDTFTPMKTGTSTLNVTYDAGDGLHINAAGDAILATTILAAAPEILKGTPINNPSVNNISVENVTPTHVLINTNLALNESLVPAASAFAVSGKTISNVAVSGKVITLTDSTAFLNRDAILVSYAKPATNPLTALVGSGTLSTFTIISGKNNVLIVDADGNTYTPLKIGTQTWLQESLKTTKYNDGSSIPHVTVANDWKVLTTDAYDWYASDIANKTPGGALYNWFTLQNAKGIAPLGYHLPTIAELQTLYNYLGGLIVAGNELKITGTTYWTTNIGATGVCLFNFIGVGYRDGASGTFINQKTLAMIWSKDAYDANDGKLIYMVNTSGAVVDTHGVKTLGVSIRCIKDS
jgi:uncharacterized protein (TIGR02145 family)